MEHDMSLPLPSRAPAVANAAPKPAGPAPFPPEFEPYYQAEAPCPARLPDTAAPATALELMYAYFDAA